MILNGMVTAFGFAHESCKVLHLLRIGPCSGNISVPELTDNIMFQNRIPVHCACNCAHFVSACCIRDRATHTIQAVTGIYDCLIYDGYYNLYGSTCDLFFYCPISAFHPSLSVPCPFLHFALCVWLVVGFLNPCPLWSLSSSMLLTLFPHPHLFGVGVMVFWLGMFPPYGHLANLLVSSVQWNRPECGTTAQW